MPSIMKMKGKIKIILLAVFNTLCILIGAIDTGAVWIWCVFAVLLVMNTWIIIEQLHDKKE